MNWKKICAIITLFVITSNAYAQKKADYPDKTVLEFILSQTLRELAKGFADWRAGETPTATGKQYSTLFRITVGDAPKIFLENNTWYYTDVLLSGADRSVAEETQSSWQRWIAETKPSWTVKEKKNYDEISITGFTGTEEKSFTMNIVAYPLDDKWEVTLVAALATDIDNTAIALLAPGANKSSGTTADMLNNLFSDPFSGSVDADAAALRHTLDEVYSHRSDNLVSLRGNLMPGGSLYSYYESKLKNVSNTKPNYLQYTDASFLGGSTAYVIPIDEDITPAAATVLMQHWRALLASAYPEENKDASEETDENGNLKVVLSKDLSLAADLSINGGWMMVLETTGSDNSRNVVLSFKIK